MQQLEIRNQTRGTLLSQEGILADTPWLRLRGLIGRQPLQEGQTLLLKPCQSVHTCFMSYPIDVLYLDKNNRVIYKAERLRPFRFAAIKLHSQRIAEFSPGSITRSGTEVGDTLEIHC